MSLSIRDQIPGTITSVTAGKAMSTVKDRLRGGQDKISVEGGELTAAITKDAVGALGLSAGTSVVALIKSTEISLATA
ncbi:TOBE domain-containing protein [Streptomyces sp. NPDC048272]|uniref:TOBE domain-containing protein n=1 Tax=Streptomyces sp. NPDC048272 TaxID=3154616 RepID=UPI003417B5F5